MGRLVPNFSKGGWLGFWLKFGFCSNFVFGSPFFLPEEADNTAKNFQIWQKKN
jgi:hypothetical protein